MTGLEFSARQMQGSKGKGGNRAVLSGTWSQEELCQAQQLGCKIFDKPYRIGDIEAWLEAREKHIPCEIRLLAFNAFDAGGIR